MIIHVPGTNTWFNKTFTAGNTSSCNQRFKTYTDITMHEVPMTNYSIFFINSEALASELL